MSLPAAFGTTLDDIPGQTPYLLADPAKVALWRERLVPIQGVRVGLVWAGDARGGDAELVATDRRRSMALATLAPLLRVSECGFVSLQLGPPAAQARTLPHGMVLHDHTRLIGDFADTAALIETLDLVISVDTSTLHLAGALGKPVWLLNRFDTCWRWLTDRTDSPWYPTLRQFRQKRPGDWDGVIQDVAPALKKFARGAA